MNFFEIECCLCDSKFVTREHGVCQVCRQDTWTFHHLYNLEEDIDVIDFSYFLGSILFGTGLFEKNIELRNKCKENIIQSLDLLISLNENKYTQEKIMENFCKLTY